MTDLIVGCPVYRRAWVLDQYFDALEAQDFPAKTRFVFALSYDKDGRDPDGTAAVIERRCPDATILEVPGAGYEDAERASDGRYAYLADVRNRLLRTVAHIDPRAFLSVDSDILLQYNAYGRLASTLSGWQTSAAGALVDMGTPESGPAPSWMMLDADWAERPAARAVDLSTYGYLEPFPVGVIMGAKLLTRHAFRNCRYTDHLLGEDIGFAIQMRAMQIQPYLVPAARGEHVLR